MTFKTFVLSRELKKLGCYADYHDLQDDFIGLHQIEEKLYELKANVGGEGETIMKRLNIESA